MLGDRHGELRLEGLGKTFGAVKAVDDVSLEIDSGEMVGVIGASGAGKSTLLKLINRLIEPDDGSVTCGPLDVSDLRGKALLEWRADCAMIFQHFNLVERLDAATNVLLGRLRRSPSWLSLVGWFSREDRLRAARALERVELLDFGLQRAGRLSGGQQQRVAIARALVQEPRILLADEPVSALDPRSAAAVMELLHKINREDDITVLANLHDLELARRYCDRIVAMRAGRVVFDGSPGRLDAAAIERLYRREGDAPPAAADWTDARKTTVA
ncbi:MAG: phosphonate ABC transporter ATP-binding protein [Acidobacteria bacterium]|nr:phosphonate ABC transporter ATP-binding protein [Acidobacteriota bacterium]